MSTPLDRDELTERVRPPDFGIAAVLGRLRVRDDLLEPVLHGDQAPGRARRRLERPG